MCWCVCAREWEGSRSGHAHLLHGCMKLREPVKFFKKKKRITLSVDHFKSYCSALLTFIFLKIRKDDEG